MLLKALYKAGGWQFCMNFLNDFSIMLVFLFTTIIAYNQRVDYPTTLVENQCIQEASDSVSICFSDFTSLTPICQSICNEIEQCWFHSRNGQCLVGGDLLIVLCGVMNSFLGLGVAFSAITAITKTISSAAYFLEVINHEDTLNKDQQGIIPSSSQGDIIFKDISFQYESRDTQVLKNLQLTIHEGEMLGIVGESGSGKSTILKLLMRLYSPSSGTIEWNKQDVTTLSIPWIHDQISYVAQEPVLFSGTIRENIQYGHIGCTEEEMIEAAKLVEADSFIRSFPKGYDTFVGELGNSLSGGQKQRIAIARALLRKPRILVLDEATSALDSQSEEIVQRAIEKMRQDNKKQGGNLSIVIVAHRLSSIRNCDRIVVMDEGHIVEEGTHDNLMKKGGIYYGLYQSQLTSGISVNTSIEESTIQEQQEESKQSSSSTSADETPSTSSTKQYSFKTIYSYFGKLKWLFWIALLGDFFLGIYPPLYGIIVAYMHAIPFYEEISHILTTGLLFTLFMGILAFIHSLGNLLWWNVGSKVKENMIVTIRQLCFSKLLYLPIAYFDSAEHSSGIR